MRFDLSIEMRALREGAHHAGDADAGAEIGGAGDDGRDRPHGPSEGKSGGEAEEVGRPRGSEDGEEEEVHHDLLAAEVGVMPCDGRLPAGRRG